MATLIVAAVLLVIIGALAVDLFFAAWRSRLQEASHVRRLREQLHAKKEELSEVYDYQRELPIGHPNLIRLDTIAKIKMAEVRELEEELREAEILELEERM